MQETLNKIDKEFEKMSYNPSIKQDVADYLSALCSSKKPVNILEIGTNLGKSSLIMLKNSPNSKITTLEKDADIFEKAKANFIFAGVMKNINQVLGDAKDTLKNLPSNTYDLVFLDGPKGQYINYLPQLKRVLTLGGVLVADNVFFKGKVLAQGIIEKKHRTIVVNLKKFLYEVQNDNSFETQILNLGDGLSVSKKIAE
jgi:predicted O-methyltransferase YrrM